MRGLVVTLVFILFENLALADLVPATSEDLNDFDRQISLSQTKSSGTALGQSSGNSKGLQKTKKDNFGAAVAAEAKGLKDLPQDQRQGLGKWVSEQRRQNERNQTGGGNGNAVGGAAGASNDARNSSPANKDVGNSGNGNGKNK